MNKVIVLASLAVLTGCDAPPDALSVPDNTPSEPNYEVIAKWDRRNITSRVIKIVDTESGVICYVVEGMRADTGPGISCMAAELGERYVPAGD